MKGINWISLIGGYLLIMPLILGVYKGLPNELEMMKQRIHSFLGSIQWIASYICSFWLMKVVLFENRWDFQQVTWIKDTLNQSMLGWFITLPLLAIIISWFLNIFFRPIVLILMGIVQHMQKWSFHLPNWLSRPFSVVLQFPKAILHTLIFALVLHFATPYLHSPELSKMMNESSYYQWVSSKAIYPLMESSIVKQLPVLSGKANNWLKDLSKEAAQNGPSTIKGYVTWQTRFDSDQEIDATAKEIVKGATSDREKAYRLYKWIGSHVSYDYQKADMIEKGQYQTLAFGSIPTFEKRKGVCSDYSSLMVTMGRAVGLKVKQEFGEGLLPDGSSGPHAWNVVYLSKDQKWIPCDPTWEQSGDFFNNPDFYKTHKAEEQAA